MKLTAMQQNFEAPSLFIDLESDLTLEEEEEINIDFLYTEPTNERFKEHSSKPKDSNIDFLFENQTVSSQRKLDLTASNKDKKTKKDNETKNRNRNNKSNKNGNKNKITIITKTNKKIVVKRRKPEKCKSEIVRSKTKSSKSTEKTPISKKYADGVYVKSPESINFDSIVFQDEDAQEETPKKQVKRTLFTESSSPSNDSHFIATTSPTSPVHSVSVPSNLHLINPNAYPNVPVYQQSPYLNPAPYYRPVPYNRAPVPHSYAPQHQNIDYEASNQLKQFLNIH